MFNIWDAFEMLQIITPWVSPAKQCWEAKTEVHFVSFSEPFFHQSTDYLL